MRFLPLLFAAVFLTFASCGGEDELDFELGGKPSQGYPGGGSSDNKPNEGDKPAEGENGGFIAQQKKTVAQRLEVPALRPGNLLISHWSVENGDSVMTYCLEYDYSKFHSRWVAFRFDATTRAKKVGRKDYSIKPQYPSDPNLDSNTGLKSDALYGSSYNHGHLCASADRLYSRTANDNTFYMTNMSPQLSKFNSPYWSTLENHVQDKGRSASFADTLYVCKGGTISSGLTLSFVAGGRMPVPKYYFMALLRVKNGTYSSIGFLMEHKNYGFNPSPSTFRQHAMSIDELEEFTGIDFFHNLPDIIEAASETRCDLSSWGL